MNQEVIDISETLRSMADEMRLMRETIASQHTEICRLNRVADKLKADLRSRDKEIRELKEKLAKYEKPGKDSSWQQYPSFKGESESRSHTPHQDASQVYEQEARRSSGS